MLGELERETSVRNSREHWQGKEPRTPEGKASAYCVVSQISSIYLGQERAFLGLGLVSRSLFGEVSGGKNTEQKAEVVEKRGTSVEHCGGPGGRDKQKNGAGERLLFKGQQGDMTFCVTVPFTAVTQELIPLIRVFLAKHCIPQHCLPMEFFNIDKNKMERCTGFGWGRINFLHVWGCALDL